MSATVSTPTGPTPTGPGSHLTIDANPLAVRDIGPWLHDLLVPAGIAETDPILGRLELAVHEICMNVVDHAGLAPGSSLELDGHVDGQGIRIEIHDEGSAFDSSGVPEPVPGVPQVRGYGLMIVRQLVDVVDYRRTDGHNTWTLQLHRPSAPSEPAAPSQSLPDRQAVPAPATTGHPDTSAP